MNIKTQMSQAAAKIHPNKSLAKLCVSYPRYERPESDRQALYNILWSGGYYFDPYWLSCYYPISKQVLENIKFDHTLSGAVNIAA